nr:hypothetical protein [Rhodoferax sp.]
MTSAALSKTTSGALPAVSPFKRVAMEGTHDDLLACAATLCGKSMEDVIKTAIVLGMRANGPFYFDEVLFRKTIFNLSNLAVSDYKDFTSVAALPDVAVLCVDYEDVNETCRHLVWHHVRAQTGVPSFSYVIDVANWVGAHQHMTTDLSHLNMKPAWYLEISQRPSPSGKGK